MNGIARLNTDGSLDTTFNPQGGIANEGGSTITALAVQSDGKILAGGNFATFNGATVNGLVRLDTFGNVDTGYVVSSSLLIYGVNSIPGAVGWVGCLRRIIRE